MKFWWIPDECDDLFEDSRLLSSDVNILIGQCRRHHSFKDNKQIKFTDGVCEMCRERKATDAHHIRPLWSFAVEYICDGIVMGERHSVMTLDRSEYAVWNAVDNLLAVCPECHNELEIGAALGWIRILSEKYHPHLCFSYRDAVKNFRNLWKTLSEVA